MEWRAHGAGIWSSCSWLGQVGFWVEEAQIVDETLPWLEWELSWVDSLNCALVWFNRIGVTDRRSFVCSEELKHVKLTEFP